MADTLGLGEDVMPATARIRLSMADASGLARLGEDMMVAVMMVWICGQQRRRRWVIDVRSGGKKSRLKVNNMWKEVMRRSSMWPLLGWRKGWVPTASKLWPVLCNFAIIHSRDSTTR
jgi:hypothetical protein